MTPTDEQLAILDAATTSEDNLILSALAGAAKTSTLVLLAEAMPDTQMLCLAFNKRIAVEMQSRLPNNCKAMTLNSLGHRVWSDATGRRLRIEPSKTYNILTSLINDLSAKDRSHIYDNMADIMRSIDFGKACGYIPTGHYNTAKRLMDDDEFFEHLEEEPTGLECDILRSATLLSLEQAFTGLCDYNDQILMPTVFQGSFPRYPLILVDEAQDLSALNHATLRKLVKKRLIAVGDECQAIYGFRGAHADSMNELERAFSMRKMLLSISFRCPKAIVEHARWRAPHMKYPEWAVPGTVTTQSTWSAATLPENAAVICRNNAPLFALAIKLLKNGRYVELAGNDIGKSLLKIMKKFGPSSLTQALALEAVDAWELEKLEKSKARAKGAIADRAECIRIFIGQGDTLGDAMAYAEHIFASQGPLKLMTGHKSKGLEFDEVYFLNQDLIGKDNQEKNLRYVIVTRAKQSLTYVDLDNFVDERGMALTPGASTISNLDKTP